MIKLVFIPRWGYSTTWETFSSQKVCRQYIRRNKIEHYQFFDAGTERQFTYFGNTKIYIDELEKRLEEMKKPLLKE